MKTIEYKAMKDYLKSRIERYDKLYKAACAAGDGTGRTQWWSRCKAYRDMLDVIREVAK